MKNEKPTDAEALQLVLAFYCTMEPEKRAKLMALATAYAKSSPEYAREIQKLEAKH